MSCKKRGYASREQAENVMVKMWKRPARGKLPIRAYLCPGCGQWHLTSQEKR